VTTPSGCAVKVSWLPAAFPSVLAVVADVARIAGAGVGFTGRAGVGVGTVRVDADPVGQMAAIEHLRSASHTVGHVVVLRSDAAVAEKTDVWGPPGDTAALLKALKQSFDPAGILNANRGPI